jgi:hypothetical protein
MLFTMKDRKSIGDTEKTVEVLQHDRIHPSSPAIRENAWIRLMTFLRWYPSDMPTEEKLLVLKLDLSIMIFGCISFFTKYLDQQSITNAYVRQVHRPTRDLCSRRHSC